MVFVGWLFIETFTVVNTVLRLSQKYAMLSNVTVSPTEVLPVTMSTFIPHEEPTMGESRDYVSIYDYGRKELCQTFHGQKHFYEMMKTKICNLTNTFIADHVLNLCGKRDENLDIWVSVLFDLDGLMFHQQPKSYVHLTSLNNGRRPKPYYWTKPSTFCDGYISYHEQYR